jgi:hypothetical protein
VFHRKFHGVLTNLTNLTKGGVVRIEPVERPFGEFGEIDDGTDSDLLTGAFGEFGDNGDGRAPNLSAGQFDSRLPMVGFKKRDMVAGHSPFGPTPLVFLVPLGWRIWRN